MGLLSGSDRFRNHSGWACPHPAAPDRFSAHWRSGCSLPTGCDRYVEVIGQHGIQHVPHDGVIVGDQDVGRSLMMNPLDLECRPFRPLSPEPEFALSLIWEPGKQGKFTMKTWSCQVWRLCAMFFPVQTNNSGRRRGACGYTSASSSAACWGSAAQMPAIQQGRLGLPLVNLQQLTRTVVPTGGRVRCSAVSWLMV